MKSPTFIETLFITLEYLPVKPRQPEIVEI